MQLRRETPEPPLSGITGAWDCHVHVFGPPGRYPLARERRYTPHEAPVEAAALHARWLGVRHLVLVQPSPYGDDNRCLLDALTALGPESRGVVSLHPARLDDTVLVDLQRHGVRGVRLNPYGRVHSLAAIADRLVGLTERLSGTGWHIALNSTPELAPEILSFARPGCGVSIVFDHVMGLDPMAPSFARSLEIVTSLVEDDERVWLKLSGIDRVCHTPGARAAMEDAIVHLIATAPDRLVWGSDWPHTPLVDGATGFRAVDELGDIQALVRLLGSSAERILSLNASRLFR